MSEIKLNLDGIHMDMDELLKKYDNKFHSCDDGMEIQQISLFCQNNRNDYRRPVLMDMIKPEFAFAGLYPHVHQVHDIKPEVSKAIKLQLSSVYGAFGPNKDEITIIDHVDLISDKPISEETRGLIEDMDEMLLDLRKKYNLK